MKKLYFECASGISGDMTVASLLDLGADEAVLREALASLPLSGYGIEISRVSKSGLDCCDFNVILDAEHENHDHDMEYLHGHDHSHDDHNHHHAHDHSHEHSHEGDHEHHHEHSHEEGHEHYHEHSHEEDHEHSHVHACDAASGDHTHEHHHHDHDHECGCGHDHEEHEHHHHDHDHECGCGHDHHDHHHHHADEVFTSWGRETIKKYTREGLEKMLEALSASEDYGIILRAKGMLPAEDGTWIYFDMVPEETEIREGAPEYTGRLCVIGSKLKEDKLAELFGLA